MGTRTLKFRIRLSRWTFFMVLVAASLGSCSPQEDPGLQGSDPVPSTRRLPSSPPPSPTPDLVYEVVDLAVLKDGSSGRVSEVVGLLENRSGFAVENVQLSVTLIDEAGSLAAEVATRLLQARVAPEESAAFAARFEGLEGDFTPRVEVTAYEPAQFQRVSIQAETDSDPGGWSNTPNVLGELSNTGREHVLIGAVILIARDREARLIGVSRAISSPAGLPPGNVAPFVAAAAWEGEPAEIEVHVDAIAAEPFEEPVYSFTIQPRLEQDDQGNPFLLGVLQNDDRGPRGFSFQATVSLEAAILAVANFTSPIPLAPGDRLSFTVSDMFGPGVDLAGRGDLGQYEIAIFMDPAAWLPSPGRLRELQLTIASIERIGSSLFIEGEALNAGSSTLGQPAVVGSLRNEAGQVLLAASAEGGSALQPNEVFQFMLRFPLPVGLELNEVEFDLRAFGLEV